MNTNVLNEGSLKNSLARFKQVNLLHRPTPLHRLDRLSSLVELRGVNIHVKRDDLAADIGGGGNKLRKLEFLLPAVLEQGCDTIITVGGRQSNHARLTAAAAARFGLRCELILSPSLSRNDDDFNHSGNMLLDGLFGAHIHELPIGADSLAFAQARMLKLEQSGQKVKIIPLGGSSPLGSLGYAACAVELIEQARAAGIDLARVVIPNGSSGSQAGLIAGFVHSGGHPGLVKGYAVLEEGEQSRVATYEKAKEALALLGCIRDIAIGDIEVDGLHRGAAYGAVTAEMIETVKVVACTEGLLLDPTYGGKAFAGLLHDIRAGMYERGDHVVFVMTGGLPGLFAYRQIF